MRKNNMEVFLHIVLPMAFGVAFAFIISPRIRDVLKIGEGPLIPVRSNHSLSKTKNIVEGMYRGVIFYGATATIITFGSAGVITLLDENYTITKGALIVAIFLLAIGRFSAMNYSSSMLKPLYSLALGVFAAWGYMALKDPKFGHEIVARSIEKNPDLIPIYGIGIFVVGIVNELCLIYGGKFLNQTIQVPYSLFREHHEGQELYEMTSYREPMVKMFEETTSKTIQEMGLRNFVWKTWSGEPTIAEVILDNICMKLTSVEGREPYRYMTNKEDIEILREEARDYIRNLEKKGQARIIMPKKPSTEKACNFVEKILGIRPRLIPDVGNKRYLIINHCNAIFSSPIPSESSQTKYGMACETGSNFAIVVQDRSRINECLLEFNNLWEIATIT
jgi:hypothetical protein